MTTAPVFLGFDYGGDDAAAARVYGRAQATLRDCSVFRTCSADRRTWRLFVVDQSGAAATFDWAPGRPVEVTAEERAMFGKRRLRALLEAPVGADKHHQEAHYEQGAVITDSGGMEEVPVAICDFCGEEGSIADAVTVVADSFRLEVAAVGFSWKSLSSWLACSTCAPIVRERDVEKLAVYIVALRIEQGHFGEDDADAQLTIHRLMYDGLFRCTREIRPALKFQMECQHPAADVGPWGPNGGPVCRVCGKRNP